MEDGLDELVSPLETVFKFLHESIGFTSVRYWLIADDRINDDCYLVLAKVHGNEVTKERIGESLSVVDTSAFPNGFPKEFDRVKVKTQLKCVQIKFEESDTSEIQRLNKKFGITDDSFVHIPVLCHGKAHGQLSCGYNDPNHSPIDKDSQNALEIVGMVLGDYLQIQYQKRLDLALSEFKNNIEPKLIQEQNLSETLYEICKSIRDLLRAEHVSAFDHNWYEDELVRVKEVTTSKEGKAKESYEVDQYLTGKAFFNEKYRSVPSLKAIIENKPELIYQPAFQKYANGKNCGSIAYGQIGLKEHKSLIRVYNHADDCRIPFDFFELDLLNRACERFSTLYDDIITTRSLDSLQDYSIKVAKDVYDVKQNIKLAIQKLSDDWVNEIIFYGKTPTEKHTTVYCASSKGNVKQFSIHSTPLVKALSTASESSKIKLVDFKYRLNGQLYDYLIKRGYEVLIVYPNNTPEFDGGAAIPTSLSAIRKDAPNLHRSTINSYASILSQHLYFSKTSIASSSARNLLGHFGHEAKTPINQVQHNLNLLAQTFENLLIEHPELNEEEITVRKLTENDKFVDAYETLGEHIPTLINKMTRYATMCRRIVDSASSLAQQSGETIYVNCQPFSLQSLLIPLSHEIAKEVKELHNNPPFSCRFEFNKAFHNLPNIIGDISLIEKIFENVFRNAVKYSNPPPKGTKYITIRVNASPQQSQLDIFVIDWGHGIEEENYEKIFMPFERHEVVHDILARRGMGLGLYVARTFALAHRGNVVVDSVVNTFDDKRRIYDMTSGKLTTFRITLDLNLKRGVYSYDGTNGKLTRRSDV